MSPKTTLGIFLKGAARRFKSYKSISGRYGRYRRNGRSRAACAADRWRAVLDAARAMPKWPKGRFKLRLGAPTLGGHSAWLARHDKAEGSGGATRCVHTAACRNRHVTTVRSAGTSLTPARCAHPTGCALEPRSGVLRPPLRGSRSLRSAPPSLPPSSGEETFTENRAWQALHANN
mgnify:CR=1 FL=1